MQNKWIKDFIMWFTGGTIYFFLEIIARGYSHYSMFICGGLCFLLVGKMSRKISGIQISNNKYLNKVLRYLICVTTGGVIITLLEFVTGLIFNVCFHMGVWDYSNMKYNFMGQICLEYSILWIILSAVIKKIYDDISQFIFE